MVVLVDGVDTLARAPEEAVAGVVHGVLVLRDALAVQAHLEVERIRHKTRSRSRINENHGKKRIISR